MGLVYIHRICVVQPNRLTEASQSSALWQDTGNSTCRELASDRWSNDESKEDDEKEEVQDCEADNASLPKLVLL